MALSQRPFLRANGRHRCSLYVAGSAQNMILGWLRQYVASALLFNYSLKAYYLRILVMIVSDAPRIFLLE